MMSRAACGHLHIIPVMSELTLKLGAPGSCPVGPPLNPILFWDVTPYRFGNSCVIYQLARRHIPANTNLRRRRGNFKVSQALREM